MHVEQHFLVFFQYLFVVLVIQRLEVVHLTVLGPKMSEELKQKKSEHVT